jgi:glycosyltransferase involved in cell wall biosynthesis
MANVHSMNKALSVIVPTYNMEQYLGECLTSMVTEKSQELLEVIVVNDGSTDRSSAIAHEYAEKYPTLFKVIDKENGHYGSCVNRGLQVATGKYVKILDADDFFYTKDLDAALTYLAESTADLVVTDILRVTIKGKIYKRGSYAEYHGKTFDIDEIGNNRSFQGIAMHYMAYRTQLLRDIHYFQPEGILYTDDVWRFTPMQVVRTISFVDKTLYCYRLGREGQSMDRYVMRKNAAHHLKIANHKLDIWEQVKDQLTPGAYAFMEEQLFHNEGNTLKFGIMYSSLTNEEMKALDDRMKVLCPEIYDKVASYKKFVFSSYRYIEHWRKDPLHYRFPLRWKVLVYTNDVILHLTQKYKFLFH